MGAPMLGMATKGHERRQVMAISGNSQKDFMSPFQPLSDLSNFSSVTNIKLTLAFD